MNQPEKLSKFEQELADAMRRVDPPQGFAERVLAEAARTQPPAKVVIMPRQRIWAGGAIAATLLAGAVLTQQVHLRHQRQQTELAQRQFETALRITDESLEHVRQQLQEAGVGAGK